jgi:ankyrin repeat protein
MPKWVGLVVVCLFVTTATLPCLAQKSRQESHCADDQHRGCSLDPSCGWLTNGESCSTWSPPDRLVGAIEADNGFAVQQLLREGVSAKTSDTNGMTVLMLAAFGGNKTGIVAMLLSAGAEPNAANNEGWTALMYAARAGKTDVILLLRRTGATVNDYNKAGDVALTLAAAARRSAAVRTLLEEGANPNGGKEGVRTPLMAAVLVGDVPSVRMLLKAGADPETKTSRDGTAMDNVEAGAALAIAVEAMKDFDASLSDFGKSGGSAGSPAPSKSPAEWAPRQEITALLNGALASKRLLRAARSGDVASARSSLIAGADPNPRYADGNAVVEAARTGNTGILKLLFSPEPSPALAPPQISSSLLEEAIQAAADNARVESLSFLLQLPGVDRNSARLTKVLAKAASSLTEPRTAKVLISAGASVNTVTDGTTPLLTAINNYKLRAVPDLLAAGADPNLAVLNPEDPRESGYTPLMAAVKHDLDGNAVSALLAAGAKVDARTSTGRTALHFAVNGSTGQVVRLLLQAKAPVNAADQDGRTPMSWAPSWGTPQAVPIYQALFEGGANPFARNNRGIAVYQDNIYNAQPGVLLMFQRETGRRTLMLAYIQKGDTAGLQVLLQGRAPVNGYDDTGITPLGAAVRAGRLEMVHDLLEHDADPSGADSSNGTPLDYALREDKKDIVNVLMGKGATTSAKGSEGLDLFHQAAKSGKAGVLKLLLDRDPQLAKGSSGFTALMQAAYYAGSSGAEVASMLLQAGADPNAADPNQSSSRSTPLHYAVSAGNVQTVKTLLAAHADINARDGAAKTPLYMAAFGGRVEVVRVLLAAGADPNLLCADYVQADDWSALMVAIYMQKPEAVQALVSGGADVNLKSRRGKTAVQLAKDMKRSDIASILKHARAK